MIMENKIAQQKNKVIQEAYGEHWETVKEFVDENGWCIYFPCSIGTLDWYGTGTDSVKYRPKSIQGIETNNEWIKIESVFDLPTDKTTQYSTCKDKKVFQSTVNCGTVKHWFNVGKITHYQPIIKPLEPLY